MTPEYALKAEKLSREHDETIQVMEEQIGCTEEAKESIAKAGGEQRPAARAGKRLYA